MHIYDSLKYMFFCNFSLNKVRLTRVSKLKGGNTGGGNNPGVRIRSLC